MHELSLTQDLVELVQERCGERRVTRIVLEVGALALVKPDAFRFCFELCAAGTVAEAAELEIVETPGLARCRSCGAETELASAFATCACGSIDLDWLRGEQLRLRTLEVL